MPKQSVATAKSSASAAVKTAGTAAGTVAKHVGLKAAAIILAGVVGGGGATYGIIKNADKIPSIKNLSGFQQDNAEEDTKLEETNDENEAELTETPEETTDITETPEPTETPDTEDTESADSSEEATEDEGDYSSYPEYPVYKEMFESFASNLEFTGFNASRMEIALYDMDQDGTNELLISHGTCEADWQIEVYTLLNGSEVTWIGNIGAHVSLYAAPDGNGIYSTFAKMGYEKADCITKNGNSIEETVAVAEHEIAPDAEYTEYDNPIKFFNIAQECYDGTEEKEAVLNLIAGIWYTAGGMPYNLKVEFSGDDMKAYLPDSTEIYFDRTVQTVFKTDYGYFYVINDNGSLYGYHLETDYPQSMLIVDVANPYAESSSMTDSLCRDNGKLSN